MTDAWMVRSIQRQKLLNEAQTEIIRLEDECDNPKEIQRKLIQLCISFLSGEELSVDNKNPVESLFLMDLLPGIKEFSRANEETMFLIGELLSWLISSFTREFYGALTAKEISDPKKMFLADSATSDIPLGSE